MKKADSHRMGFDFELGDVKRSPCRDCYSRGRFPGCMADCKALDYFQRVLARAVSSRRDNGIETHTVNRSDYYRTGL